MPFISSSCLTAAVRTSSTIWIKVVEVDRHPCPIPDLKEKALSLPSEYDVACRFIICSLYYVKVCSLYSQFATWFVFFFINGCWILSNALSASIDVIMRFLSFILFMWCIMFIDLQIYHPCIPGMNLTWSWCMVFLIYCWIGLPIYLLRTLASIFIRNIDL